MNTTLNLIKIKLFPLPILILVAILHGCGGNNQTQGEYKIVEEQGFKAQSKPESVESEHTENTPLEKEIIENKYHTLRGTKPKNLNKIFSKTVENFKEEYISNQLSLIRGYEDYVGVTEEELKSCVEKKYSKENVYKFYAQYKEYVKINEFCRVRKESLEKIKNHNNDLKVVFDCGQNYVKIAQELDVFVAIPEDHMELLEFLKSIVSCLQALNLLRDEIKSDRDTLEACKTVLKHFLPPDIPKKTVDAILATLKIQDKSTNKDIHHNHSGYVTFCYDENMQIDTDVLGSIEKSMDILPEKSCVEVVSEFLTFSPFTYEYFAKISKLLTHNGVYIHKQWGNKNYIRTNIKHKGGNLSIKEFKELLKKVGLKCDTRDSDLVISKINTPS